MPPPRYAALLDAGRSLLRLVPSSKDGGSGAPWQRGRAHVSGKEAKAGGVRRAARRSMQPLPPPRRGTAVQQMGAAASMGGDLAVDATTGRHSVNTGLCRRRRRPLRHVGQASFETVEEVLGPLASVRGGIEQRRVVRSSTGDHVCTTYPTDRPSAPHSATATSCGRTSGKLPSRRVREPPRSPRTNV
jgi:hypothetical protein